MTDSLPPLESGSSLGEFTIVRLIGHGGYGHIYEVSRPNDSIHFALKTEYTIARHQSLLHEKSVMRILKAPFFPSFISMGSTSNLRYLVMELFGPSFDKIRRLLPHYRFSLSTVLRIGFEMLRAIESCHSLGIVHGDVKPANFLIRPSRRYPVVLIDFGFSIPINRHQSEHNFVGTLKYASIDTHLGREIGRRDDLFSWFYGLIEMWAGKLPWTKLTDPKKIYAMKLSIDMIDLIQKMPKPIWNVWKLLKKLSHAEEPPYRLIMAFIEQAIIEMNVKWEDPYEWELMEVGNISAIQLIPTDEREPMRDLPNPVMPNWSALFNWDPRRTTKSVRSWSIGSQSKIK
jgi:serine/threonine protein kinase